MAVIPLTVRSVMYAEHSEEIEVALVTITHADLAAPVRVSSDTGSSPLSIEPLRFGTISRGNEYDFVLMSAIVPDDRKGTPPRVALVFENIESNFIETAQSFVSPATASIELVLASAPDTVIQAYRGLRIVRCSFDDTSATFDLSREPFVSEPFGARQTKNFFPGLHGIPSA
ncbi:MAG: hypothetical protein WC026_16085 [Hyphomicrobium sp.]|uniref:hypothetical protein n=1 Tax=Hyphomicrobium sp. TaxID=82 RepID=UPI0035662775